ncbi:hypothetical protein MNEG_6160 [Monoraphidium neglectum]|uniref:Serine-threonine/tyrosine-protein kinase catalytic domain-containing protein n=1 Tax=Monoraphidium neglectum TaxID=145388 RepID=A0A0D2JS25_9CHLO|nr:hypothetical protein MNEG_6160 [Monoraphidium neglectum]KIZ01803.1 hypothetical protein MNEG_6160 [Monoraphidium neglectum]|eukprot:XP_013900822.1 hypothetical protein MNEG_6160 [Monoraphidium neglectum]
MGGGKGRTPAAAKLAGKGAASVLAGRSDGGATTGPELAAAAQSQPHDNVPASDQRETPQLQQQLLQLQQQQQQQQQHEPGVPGQEAPDKTRTAAVAATTTAPPSGPTPVPLAQRRSVVVSPLVGAIPLTYTPHAPRGGLELAGPDACTALGASSAPHLSSSAPRPSCQLPAGPRPVGWTAPSNLITPSSAPLGTTPPLASAPASPFTLHRVQRAAVQQMLLQQQSAGSPLQRPRAGVRGGASPWSPQYGGVLGSVLTAPAGGAAAAAKPPAFTAPAACTCGDLAGAAAAGSDGGGWAPQLQPAGAARRYGLLRRCNSCQASDVRYHLTEGVGSWCYMAPEVLLGRAYNERADTFSFGVVMYEVFSRHMLLSEHAAHASPGGAGGIGAADPRAIARDWAVRVAHGHRPVLPAGWPEGLRDLIDCCWAQDAAERPSLAEVVRRLRALRDASPDGSTATS